MLELSSKLAVDVEELSVVASGDDESDDDVKEEPASVEELSEELSDVVVSLEEDSLTYENISDDSAVELVGVYEEMADVVDEDSVVDSRVDTNSEDVTDVVVSG